MRIGYVRKSNRSAASGQFQRLEAFGLDPRRIWTEGYSGETFEAMLDGLRDGDAVCVDTLADLASTRKELEQRIEAVHGRDCYVLEVSTGLRSNVAKEALKMVFVAADRIGNFRKRLTQKEARERGSKGGRPGRKFTRDEKRTIKMHWHSNKHDTNEDAVAAINADGIEIDEQQVRRLMKSLDGHGRSGRPPGKRKSDK